MNALEAAKVAEAALEDKLGEDIKVLDLRGLSNIADCFVIASGAEAVSAGRKAAPQRGLQRRHLDSAGFWQSSGASV